MTLDDCSQGDRRTVIFNPLPAAMRHYCFSLSQTFARNGIDNVSVILERGEIEGNGSKVRALLGHVLSVVRLILSPRATITVVWPLLGFAEIVLWVPVSLRHRVMIIMHDPMPLRPQHGYGNIAKKACRLLLKSSKVELLAHTALAQSHISAAVGAQATVIPHPIARLDHEQTQRNHLDSTQVSVIGQYKEARDLNLLGRLGELLDPSFTLSISGRGWPDVVGWRVNRTFMSETQLTEAIKSSSVVLLPYDYYYQSGVAVRCLELNVPVVGRDHEFLRDLFGREWCGLAPTSDPEDWLMCLDRTLQASPDWVASARALYEERTDVLWGKLLTAG